MLACLVSKKERRVKVGEWPEPPCGPTQLLLKIQACGICGTDREIASFQYGEPPQGRDEFVLGHEAAAQVQAVGSAVEDFGEGDWVVPVVRRPCPHASCRACRVGRQDFCTTGDFTECGIRGADGFMAELAAVDQAFCIPVPESLGELAVLTEPLTIAEKAIEQVFAVQARLPYECQHQGKALERGPGHCHRALVLGAGPVGLLGALALRLRDFEVVIYSKEAPGGKKSELARAMGARYLSAQETAIPEIEKRVGPLDLIYEAAGATGVAFAMMQALSTNGIFCFTGVPGRRGPLSIEADDLMRQLVLQNQVVFGTVNAGKEAYFQAAQDLLAIAKKFPGLLPKLITQRAPLKRAPSLLTEAPSGIKNLLLCHG